MEPNTTIYYNLWKSMVSWVDMYLIGLSDDDLNKEIMPGGNHGIWLLGHLIVCEDDLSEYVGKGVMLFPEYQELFTQGSILQPVANYPTASVLRESWSAVCSKNNALYQTLTDNELKDPHNKIESSMEDDFFKTKEGCLRNWILHQMHHTGQLAVLRVSCGKDRLI